MWGPRSRSDHPGRRVATARRRFASSASLRRASAATALAASLTVVLTAATLSAQTVPGSIELGAESGRYIGGTLARGSNAFFTSKAEVDEDLSRGFWLAAHVTPNWAVEVTYRRTATSVIGYSGGVFPQQPTLAGLDVAVLEGVVERCYRIGRFAPYVGAGAGFTNLDVDLPDGSRRNPTRGSLAVTGGARFYLTTWLGVRVDMRARAAYLGKRSEPYDRGWHDAGRWYESFEGIGGVFVALSGW